MGTPYPAGERLQAELVDQETNRAILFED